LKPERWGSPLVQEKCREEKACDKRHPYRIIIIITRHYKKYILKQSDTDELCRRCGKESETIQHITATCEQLAPTEYVKRHDGLAKVIHQKLAEAAELIDDKSPYYKYTPANVLENEHFKLYWNRSILTDKTVPFNRPDITCMNKKTKNTILIDIAVPNIKLQKSVILSTCSIVRNFLNYK